MEQQENTEILGKIMLPFTYLIFSAIFRKYFRNNILNPMLKDITLCLKIFLSSYVFIVPLVPVRNASIRAGCNNAFLHQFIAAKFSRHFSIHGEGLLLN